MKFLHTNDPENIIILMSEIINLLLKKDFIDREQK